MEDLEELFDRADGGASEEQRPPHHINKKLISVIFVACLLASVLFCHRQNPILATSKVSGDQMVHAGIKNTLGLHQNFYGSVNGVTESGDVNVDQNQGYKFTWHGDNKGKGNIIGGQGGTITNIDGDVTTNNGSGMVNKGSNGNTQQNGDQNGDKIDNNDGMVGIGVKQMKACEGSGNDGSGAGAVGTVCCMSPKGPVGCDSAASGGQAIHEHGHAPNRQGQCKLDGSINGDCTCTWPGGAKWEGRCKNAKKDGKGTVTMRDGTKFVAKYNDDKPV